ncbi:methylated-DNA--[protein]-cysteine S-methyltransferase [Parabacteroides gordonii]|uniref:methylated-DNA--[protein]-cysteine S-methyltransferase n=1 Tax=Parabacteroides gordonii TaxID=574930 RepID=UPI0026ECA15B|nr:methylated-DNA--[protein]-cysteine S-methyltransferase [Parabacteroides gordonii]
MENIIYIQNYQSPCGELILGSLDGKLCLCDWMNEERRTLIDRRLQKLLHARYEAGESEVLAQTVSQLDEYFAGKRTEFDIPLLFAGTDFQKAVWNALLNIPYGKTVSYAALSQDLGNRKAIRAVAAANGANSISILVPCHRVIGSNQKLVGYAGGLSAKQQLLDLESSDKLF